VKIRGNPCPAFSLETSRHCEFKQTKCKGSLDALHLRALIFLGSPEIPESFL